jgi:hypothetical protein
MEQKLNIFRMRLKQRCNAGVLCVLALFLLVEGRTEEPPEGKYLATADVEEDQGEDQGDSVIQNQPTLRELLSSPPWIKKIVFKRSGNYTTFRTGELNDSDSDVEYPVDLGYEGALQPLGFYLRHLANSNIYLRRITPEKELVFENPKKGSEFIVGESKEHYWSLSPGHSRLSFSYKDPKLGGNPENSRQSLASWQRRILIEFRRFGLEHMGRCDLKWAGRNQFSGISEKLGAISGKIVARDDQERPMQLHYWPDSNLDDVVKVRYKYHTIGTIPRMFAIEGAIKGKPRKVLTNFIEHIEVGIDELNPQGYNPTDFRQNIGPLKGLVVTSNTVRYSVDQRGHWKKVDDSPHSLDDLRDSGNSPSYGWALLVFCLFCLSALVIVEKRRRNKKLG